MMTKRKTSLWLGLLAVLSIVWMLHPAYAADVSFSMNDVSAQEGEEMVINLTIPQAVGGIDNVMISFEHEYLEFLRWSGGVGDNKLLSSVIAGPSSITIKETFGEGAYPLQYSFVFRALKAGTTYVNVVFADAYDGDGEALSVDLGYSAVTITAPPTEPPITEEPTTEEPATEEPATEEPITEEPTTEEPITEEPITEEPITEEPTTEEPATEEPTTEEPTTEEPATEEPATEEPTTEELTTEEPTTEEPTTDEPTDPPEEETTTEAPTTREVSHDAALSYMALLGEGSLVPAFSPDIYQYTQTISSDTASLEIRYNLRHERSSAWFNRYLNEIPYGETDFYIHVTAEDGYTTQNYHVTIVRPEPVTQPPAEEETAPPTEPEETTTEEETTEEPTTEESEESSEPETEPSTEPATEPEEIMLLEGSPLFFKILPIPQEDELPAGYVKREIKYAGGGVFEALVPEKMKKPDHYIVYGIRLKEVIPEETEPETTEAESEEETEPAEGEETLPPEESSTPVSQRVWEEYDEPGYFVYDLKDKTLQRLGLLVVPETTVPETEPSAEPATTEPETQAPTQAPTESAAPTTQMAAPTDAPPTQAPGTAAESTAAPTTDSPGGGLWWLWIPAAVIAAVGSFVIIRLSGDKKELKEELKTRENLSPEEEKTFLSMDTAPLFTLAKDTNSPWTVEDLDQLLEEEEAPASDETKTEDGGEEGE